MNYTNLLNKFKQILNGSFLYKKEGAAAKKSHPERTFYEIFGKEAGLRLLISNFYQKMEDDPLAKDCLMTHELTEENKIPESVREKLFMFLSGWLGGPNLFVEKLGAPKMMARHSHIKIGSIHKNQWLYCMEHALNKHQPPLNDQDFGRIINSFMALAERIQNSE